MTRLEAFISLNMVDGLGSVKLASLLKSFKNPENIFKASYEELMRIPGIGQEIASQIVSLKNKDLDKELSLIKKLSLQIITLEDKDYPLNLKQIPGAPIVLYIKGELKEEDKNSIAIVGSRRASFYGLSSAERFAGELAEKGFTIISGMARGIDSAAHRGCLKVGGRTIAVIGSGLANIYPEENMELADEISQSGAVISEFPLNTPPKKENFPRRNRIISGLSLGTLVVEAARNGGALITADFALEQGREVFALPGKIDFDNSFGTNGLIKQGAKLVSCVDDILEEFNLDRSTRPKIKEQAHKLKSNLIDRDSILYNLISSQPILLDDIVEKTNLEVAVISDILLRLQMKKLIKQLPGKQFIRN